MKNSHKLYSVFWNNLYYSQFGANSCTVPRTRLFELQREKGGETHNGKGEGRFPGLSVWWRDQFSFVANENVVSRINSV